MSVSAPLNAAVPEETIRVARDAFPKGNIFMRMHDELGPLYRNPQFAALFSHTGQPASIIASATLCPYSLADCLSRRTERSRGYLDGCEYGSKH
jgi:hypothetical protein